MGEDRVGVTKLLRAWRDGDEQALPNLLPLVYGELRRIASQRVRLERRSVTLRATALVHEVFLRLVEASRIDWQSRAHFFAIAARLMRQILVEQARRRSAQKRAGQASSLDEVTDLAAERRSAPLLALDEALARLAVLDGRQHCVVELRYFGGLTNEEVAAVLGISVATVKREWVVARAWLHRELTSGAFDDA
jgi:RNA polymerase sigma-70 factor (ECF subfamily)